MANRKPAKPKPNLKKSKLIFRPKFIVLAFILFLAVFSVIVFVFSSSAIKYKEYKTVQTTNKKISLDVPDVFSEVQSSQDILDYQDTVSGGANETLSHARVEAQYIGSDDFGQKKQDIKNQFKSAKGEFYDIFNKKNRSGPISNELNFGQFKDYKNGKGQEGLIADFSYKDQNQPVDGKLFIAFSVDSIYFVIVEAQNKVWLDNIDTWYSIIDSFQVNTNG